MKKLLALALAIVMSLSLAACGKTPVEPSDSPVAESVQPSAEPVELTVFAAASMTETLTEVIELYKSVAPNVIITPTYDSSGTLMTQISEGAECDLFISAAQKQMNALDVTQGADKNPDKLDFIDSTTRVNILENKVVLVVPNGNPANITKFADLANAKMIAIGNSDVPVGSYSLEILKYLDLDIAALESAGKVTYGTNVKEVTTQVAEGIVDCGIVYATDANVAGLTVVDTATTEMCKQVVYPAAVLKASKNPEAAKAFLDFLKTDEAMAIFEKVGFTKVN
ncbi:MAG: molybdate ABC transporter substrate-binding protein [Firmicutes bacterium HGW-Firmicutes-16]|nr:MAG: molybdate ABC transporter substrate-binding protein [Firmicutes bacterium HGW-Firmicutes-16]